jgi:hypothetical protein
MQRSSSKAQAEPMHATPTTLRLANVNAGNFPLLIGPPKKMWRSSLTGLPIRWVSYFLVNNPRLHKQGQSNTMKNPKITIACCGCVCVCVWGSNSVCFFRRWEIACSAASDNAPKRERSAEWDMRHGPRLGGQIREAQ